jgi:hypothetical protein
MIDDNSEYEVVIQEFNPQDISVTYYTKEGVEPNSGDDVEVPKWMFEVHAEGVDPKLVFRVEQPAWDTRSAPDEGAYKVKVYSHNFKNQEM